ncbi:hypothetical protein EDD36DRAFT_439860 [Exophiala viscosa]|uniref:Uncharacterized protein n=1 Tax=Exophiala viscosa TaxID=2486360 RepID=A0AAN6DV54_9EURO|nr:hypothetical protein EDD36DRAFT_439860 [Exophiala viscosa]
MSPQNGTFGQSQPYSLPRSACATLLLLALLPRPPHSFPSLVVTFPSHHHHHHNHSDLICAKQAKRGSRGTSRGTRNP